jgi:hypothetical protein
MNDYSYYIYKRKRFAGMSLFTWPRTKSPLDPTRQPGSGILFDDFNYRGPDDPALHRRQWVVRTTRGGPGLPEAYWSKSGVSFIDDPDHAGNRLLQLTAATDGAPANTQQAEICHQRKFYEGTYASRVRFTDAPLNGPTGDHIVQTFFTITPLRFDLDWEYGELDFEYLPNGGWGAGGPSLYLTTWETYRKEPWLADNIHTKLDGSFAGWHTCLIQMAGGKVSYYIDGALQAEHGGKYYPETPMSINYNLWFIQDGLLQSAAPRRYAQHVDWIYYSGGEVLTSDQVEARIADYRLSKIKHIDTVPVWETVERTRS